jgi:hypothetical protein
MSVDYCAMHFYSYSIEELRCIHKQTLHHLLSSHSLQIAIEDALLNSLIELGSDYFDFWQYIEIRLLSTDSFSRFFERLPFDAVSYEIWLKVIDRLTGVADDNLRQRRFHKSLSLPPLPFQSEILKSVPTILDEFRTMKWTLLYRGTSDGFSSSTFHTKCDGQPNTITIILTTKGFIFGGFTPLTWDSSSTHKADNSGKSFLFSVKDPRNSEGRKFGLSNSSYAIYCHSSYGPSFGNATDLYVAPDCNANNNSQTNLGSYYVNDTGLNGQQVLADEYDFPVQEMEVFTLGV